MRHRRAVDLLRLALTFAGAIFLLTPPRPAHADGIKTAGEILRIALPAAAGGYSLYREDYDGVLQLGVSELASEGSSLLLSSFISERRPNGQSNRSFPSDSTAVAFSAASYMQIRYGWDYGLPAYALAAFVGYSRVESKEHHWGDVLAGAALGWGFSEITTVRYRNVEITPGFGSTLLGFDMHVHW
jgi:membrane-associated phospholipid phosphatase